MMVYCKPVLKIAIFIFLFTMPLASCKKNLKNDICFALDTFGLLGTKEPMLELNLEEQAIEEPFSLAKYCKEEYDSILLLDPYTNTENKNFTSLKMSDRLRNKCDNNTLFDSFSTILFIKDGEVKAYSVVDRNYVDFATNDNTDNPRSYSFEQQFIIDKNKCAHLYNERLN